MTIPSFFCYDIQVNKQKIGSICAPCKWIAKNTWESVGLANIYPNATIKFKGLNFKIFKKTP